MCCLLRSLLCLVICKNMPRVILGLHIWVVPMCRQLVSRHENRLVCRWSKLGHPRAYEHACTVIKL